LPEKSRLPQPWPDRLPEASTNHAFALLPESGEMYLFYGLGPGKTWRDIRNRHWRWDKGQWQEIPPHPAMQPVLASVAVAVQGTVYLLGGYTVDANGEEKSTAQVYAINPAQNQFRLETRIPVPVDDSVALVYQNRYIYLVSGWHDTDNISRVQVYDTREKRWFEATPYPAPAVFGHAGGLWGNRMVLCDGVKVVKKQVGSRVIKDFVISPVCVSGEIASEDPARIDWHTLPHPPNPGRYRMAATAVNGVFVFAGGSETAYNYDGMGYNGVPAEPVAEVLRYFPETRRWQVESGRIQPAMDFRGLGNDGDWLLLPGGMLGSQQVSDRIQKFR
jgi:hypothetical protein